MQDLSSLTRDRTLNPCLRRWSLNHWISRTVPGRTLWIRSSVVYPSAISPPHPLWVSDPSVYLQKCCEWGNKPKVQASLRQAQTLPMPDRRTDDLKCVSWAQSTRCEPREEPGRSPECSSWYSERWGGAVSASGLREMWGPNMSQGYSGAIQGVSGGRGHQGFPISILSSGEKALRVESLQD